MKGTKDRSDLGGEDSILGGEDLGGDLRLREESFGGERGFGREGLDEDVEFATFLCLRSRDFLEIDRCGFTT